MAAWSDLGQGDHYPTVEVYLGAQVWSDREVFTRDARIISDFDTGNPTRRKTPSSLPTAGDRAS
jgi:hypothetical protein